MFHQQTLMLDEQARTIKEQSMINEHQSVLIEEQSIRNDKQSALIEVSFQYVINIKIISLVNIHKTQLNNQNNHIYLFC